MITRHSRPILCPKARLRYDRHQARYLLLYPEHGLALSPTAAAILRDCQGQLTVDELVTHLAAAFTGAERATIERDVLGLLTVLEARGLVAAAEAS